MIYDLVPAIGLLTVAAITPGPNTVFVVASATLDGASGAFRTIVAIVAGSLLLFVFVRYVFAELDKEMPAFLPAIGLIGSLYLAWMGVSLIKSACRYTEERIQVRSRSGLSLVIFQILNPKGWVLMSVFLAASGDAGTTHLVMVLPVVLCSCLCIWAIIGLALTEIYKTNCGHFWINGSMGTALVLFSVLIIFQAVCGVGAM